MIGIIITIVICFTIVLCFFIVHCVVEFDIQEIIEKRQAHKIRLKEIELEILKEKRKW